MKFKFSISLIFAQALVAAACTGGSSDPVRTHESKLDDSQSLKIEKNQNSTSFVEAQEKVESLKAFSQSAENSFKKSDEAQYLDFSSWENTAVSGTSEFKTFINNFQKQALANFEKIDKEAYVKFFGLFCNSDFNQCKHLNILKSSPYSSALLAKLAQFQTALDRRFYLTILSFEVGNQIPNEIAAIQFLTDLPAIRSKISESGKTSLLRQVENYTQLIYNNAAAKVLKIPDELLGKAIDLIASGDESQVMLSGKLYASSGKIAKILQDKIEALNNEPTGYAKKINWMKANAPHYISQLKVKNLDYDAYYFVLEQVIQHKWSSKQAAAFFKGANLELSVFNEKANIYALNLVAYVIASVQYTLFQEYKAANDSNKFRYFYSAGTAIGPRLVDARAVADQFKALLTLEDLLGGNANSNLRRIITSLPETFRISISDSVVLSLLNQGMKIGIDLQTNIPIASSKLSENVSLAYIFIKSFYSELEPLFSVMPTVATMNPFSFNESLEFAIRANFFGNEIDDADDALVRLLNLYLQLDIYNPYGYSPPGSLQSRAVVLDRAIRRFKDLPTNTLYNFAVNQCKLMDKVGVSGSMDLSDLKLSPILGQDMPNFRSVTRGTTNSAGNSRNNIGIFPADSNNTDALEWARIDMLPRLEQMLEVTKAIEADTSLRFPKFNQAVNKVKADFAYIYQSQVDQMRNFMPCWYKIMLQDRRLTSQVVMYDYLFWQWAAKTENREKFPEVFSKDLTGNVKFRSQFKGGSFTVYNFDLLIRTRYYLLYGLPFLNSPMPPLAPRLKIGITDGLAKKPIYTSSTFADVAIESTIETTARNLVRSSGFKVPDNSVSWFNSSYIQASLFNSLFEVNSFLYRMGPMAKTSLGLENIFAVDELFASSENVFQFLNLSDLERKALNILGETKRVSATTFATGPEAPYLLSEDGSLAPSYTDQLNKILISKWGSNYSDVLRWESKYDKMPRPAGLLPYPDMAILFEHHLDESNSQLAHLFRENLKASEGIKKLVANYLNQDSNVREASIKNFKNAKAMEFYLKVDEPLQFPGQNGFLVNDLQEQVDDLRKHTH